MTSNEFPRLRKALNGFNLNFNDIFFFHRSNTSDFALNLMTKDAMVSSSFYTGALNDLKDNISSATCLIGDQIGDHQCAFDNYMKSYKCSILMFTSRKYFAFNLTQQIYFTDL